MKRTLTIRREALTELSSSDLRGLAGAATRGANSCHITMWDCPTVQANCPTEPIRDCLSLNGCIQTA